MDVTWENPPRAIAGRNSRPDEVELANTLRAHPDEWARMTEFENDKGSRAANFARLIRTGERASFRTTDDDIGEFEAVSRRVPGTNITAVYVRYATLKND